jgi:hypothetical protein
MTGTELLEAILAELKAQRSTPLGFGVGSRPRYIYPNRKHSDCLWYFWNGAEHEPILEPDLTGVITRVEVGAKDFKGKTNAKVRFHIQADARYVLEAGDETTFCRSLLGAMAMLTAAELKQAITICVEAGREPGVLLCEVWQGGQKLFNPDARNLNVPDMIRQAQQKLGQAPGPAAPAAARSGQLAARQRSDGNPDW